jgi:hypothetical protein
MNGKTISQVMNDENRLDFNVGLSRHGPILKFCNSV